MAAVNWYGSEKLQQIFQMNNDLQLNYLDPSQTNDMEDVCLHHNTWINHLENTLVQYNHLAAFSDDDAVLKLEINNLTNNRFVITKPKTYITKTAVKNVQRTVVLCGFHIFNIILHFHFDWITFVIFAALEFLVTIFFHQARERPFFIGSPICLKNNKIIKYELS